MFWRKITVIVGGPAILGLLLTLGHQHDLFYNTNWFDLMMHYLGGLVVVFTLAGILWHLDLDPASRPALFKSGLILALILVSIAWEVFEVWVGMVPNWKLSMSDTVSDTLCALAGGLTALLFIRTGKKEADIRQIKMPAFDNIPE